MSGTPRAFDAEPARCFPEKPSGQCGSCSRYRCGETRDHRVVVIDASALPNKGGCPMWIRRVH